MPILMSSERALYLELDLELYLELRCRAAAPLPPQPRKASRRSVIETRMNLVIRGPPKNV